MTNEAAQLTQGARYLQYFQYASIYSLKSHLVSFGGKEKAEEEANKA